LRLRILTLFGFGADLRETAIISDFAMTWRNLYRGTKETVKYFQLARVNFGVKPEFWLFS